MGMGMVKNLIKHGHKVHVWNKTASKVRSTVDVMLLYCYGGVVRLYAGSIRIYVKVNESKVYGKNIAHASPKRVKPQFRCMWPNRLE